MEEGHSQVLRACQINEWLPDFQHLSYKTLWLHLPEDFVDFLVSDGVHALASSKAMPTREKPASHDDEDEGAYKDWSESDEDDSANHKDFSELEDVIDHKIAQLGGEVTPKLNWSCPKDSVWMSTGNTHKCTNAEEVILLLKASDRIAHDISQSGPLVHPEHKGMVLALRKWHNLRAEGELRGFVRDCKLVGVCQRNIREHFNVLMQNSQAIKGIINKFFKEHLKEKFQHENYVFDCYITTQDKVKLIDFSPIGGETSPLLFSWSELGYTTFSDSEEDGIRENGKNLGDNVTKKRSSEILCHAPEERTSQDNLNLSESESSEELHESEEKEHDSVLFRFVAEYNSMQINLPQYGVPYDMIQEGMYEDLLGKLQNSVFDQNKDQTKGDVT